MKKECEIINDLLPNYVENLVSEETKKFVNEHISNCEQCKKQLEILREDRNKINLKSKDEQKIELDYLKKYNKKMIILKIILITIITLITISIAFSIYRYIYNSKVVENVERKISEITDLNNLYLQEKRLKMCEIKRGAAWLDAGTPDSLLDASLYVQLIEKRQGLKISCIEEIAYRRGFIDKQQMQKIIAELKPGTYKNYLQNLYEEHDEVY